MRLDDFSVRILGIRDFAEFHGPDIFLVLAHQEILNLGCAPKGEEQEAGRKRIKRSAVTDFFRAKDAAGDGHHIVGCHSGCLVYRQDTINQGIGVHRIQGDGSGLICFQAGADGGENSLLNLGDASLDPGPRSHAVTSTPELSA